METEIKAVVFKTPRLHETRNLCTGSLGLKIIESSNYHFVVGAAGIRFVFMSVVHDAEVELYLSRSGGEPKNHDIEIINDVNKIRFIVCKD